MTTVPVTTQDRIPMPMHVATRPVQAGPGLSLSDMIRILKQRIFMIAFIFILFISASFGLTLWLIKNHPLYRSGAAVLVESPFAKNPMEFGENLPQTEMMNRFVADQMFIVKDDSLLREVLNDTDVRGTSWYREQPDKNVLLQELQGDLDVRQSQGTSIFIVSFATKNVEDAPKIVNTTVRKYIDKVQKMSQEKYARELTKFQQQETDLKRDLKQIRDQRDTMIASQLGSPGLTSNINVAGEVWRALAMQAAGLEMQQLQLKAQFDNLKGLDPSEIMLSPTVQMMIDQDPQVSGMKINLIDLRQAQNTILQRVGPKHTSAHQIRNQIESAQKMLDEILEQKKQEARQYQIISAETAWLNAVNAQIQLQERVDGAKAEQRDADRKLAQYQSLQEQQQLLEEQNRRVSDQINSLQLIMRGQEMVRVRPFGQAVAALERSFPSWTINMSVGTMLGLVIGIGLAVLLEVIDTSIRTSRDVTRHVHIPILGTVPELDDEELPIERVELAVHTAPRSMIAEAFRNIRANLALSSPAERQRSLLITSAKPEEGKSAVAINLAISIAQNNRRVLLVDANFHRPVLKNFFPKARPEGLSNILIGQGTLEELATPTDLPNLDLLSSGPIPPNPAELLAGNYLRTMLQEAAGTYDQVIFDGPPTLLVSDAVVLAGSLDGVVLVCRAKAVSRGVVQRARDQLERANVRIFGGILNAARVTRGGYFREQIRSYYDYQPAEVLKVSTRAALPSDEDKPQDQEPKDESAGA